MRPARHPQPLPGLEGAELAISSNEVFDLAEFPRRLLVVGGGYIAVEFASLFQRLGAHVTEVMRADNVLRGFDEDMRVGLRHEMTHAGWTCAAACCRADREARGRPAVTFSNGARRSL